MNDDELVRYLRGTGAEVVLLAAVASGPVSDHIVSASNGDEHSLFEAARELDRLGLARVDNRASGPLVQANEKGTRVARRIQKSHEVGEERWDAVVRAMAEALLSGSASPWLIEEVDGRPVEHGERQIAIKRLHKWECAQMGVNAAGGVTWMNPLPNIYLIQGINGLLRDEFEGRGGSLDQSTHATTNVQGDVGAVQTGGMGNVQTVTITVNERSEILARIQHVRDAMGPDAAPELVEAVDAIEAEATSNRASKASIGDRVQDAMLAAAASQATTAVFQALTTLLPASLGLG